jgi:hypothetical protein
MFQGRLGQVLLREFPVFPFQGFRRTDLFDLVALLIGSKFKGVAKLISNENSGIYIPSLISFVTLIQYLSDISVMSRHCLYK